MIREIIAISLFLPLAACTGKPKPKLNNADFWQRIGAVDNAYMRGPKAQQMLNRDIAHCVAEGRELVHLGALRGGLNTGMNNATRQPDQRELYKWDTPERDRYMFAEHSNFHDMEGCMEAAGWQRTLYVSYEKVDEYHRSYYDAHVDYEYQTRKIDNRRQDSMYTDLNE